MSKILKNLITRCFWRLFDDILSHLTYPADPIRLQGALLQLFKHPDEVAQASEATASPVQSSQDKFGPRYSSVPNSFAGKRSG